MTGNQHDYLAGRLEEHRTHLRAVAFRMLAASRSSDVEALLACSIRTSCL
jgi:hypothetical protein